MWFLNILFARKRCLLIEFFFFFGLMNSKILSKKNVIRKKKKIKRRKKKSCQSLDWQKLRLTCVADTDSSLTLPVSLTETDYVTMAYALAKWLLAQSLWSSEIVHDALKYINTFPSAHQTKHQLTHKPHLILTHYELLLSFSDLKRYADKALAVNKLSLSLSFIFSPSW